MLLSVVIPTRNRPDDLRELLESIRASTLLPDEIIVVDDYQTDDVLGHLREEFHEVVFIRLRERGYITGARNAGWRLAHGKYVFFVDDDNVIASDCLEICVLAAESDDSAGVIGAKTLYYDDPGRITLAGARQGSAALARTSLIGLNELDGLAYEAYTEVDTAPNAFLVRRSVLEQTQGFDEQLVQTWSEADFNARVRQAGYRVMIAGKARVWHRSPIVQLSRLSSRHVGGSPFRLYYMMRNRYVYVARYGKWWERLLFALVFSNGYLVYYLFSIMRDGRQDLLRALMAGVADGLYYMVTGRFVARQFV